MSGGRADRTRIVSLSDTRIRITRECEAPRHLLFEAWTTPEHIRGWLRDRGEATIAELRVGGKWRYVRTTADGREVVAHGEYHEVVPNERIVSVQSHEGALEAATVNTVTFTEKDGRTLLTILVEYANREQRDQHLESTRAGMPEALARLEQYAAALKET
nr:ATPase [uncultured bacterium]